MKRSLALTGLEVGTTSVILAGAWLYLSSPHGYAWTSIPSMLSAFHKAWLFARFSSDIVPSLERLLVGYGLAAAGGVVIGLVLGMSKLARLLAQPVVSFLRSLPAVALIPLSLVLMGIGNSQKIALIAFLSCWPVVLNTSEGVAELDPTLVATTQSYRLRGYARLRYVLLPAASPRIFAGLRSSLSLAVLLLVTSEMVAATNGIGFFVWQAQLTFSTPNVWAGLILLGLLGYSLNAGFGLIERRAIRWYLATRKA